MSATLQCAAQGSRPGIVRRARESRAAAAAPLYLPTRRRARTRMSLAKALAAALVEEGAAGLRVLRDDQGAAHEDGDLSCMQCGSLLFEPTTLEDGTTVCRPCVSKYREGHLYSTWTTSTLPNLGHFRFPGEANVVLTELTQRCAPKAHAAAASRHQANKLFGQGQYAEAEAIYSATIAAAPPGDVVLLCNRAAARLKLGNIVGAAEDAEFAVSLCSAMASASRPGSPMWSKAWFRWGQALLASTSKSLEAAFALALSAAADSQQPTAQLLEVSEALLHRAAAINGSGGSWQGDEIDSLKEWLRQGRCPLLAIHLGTQPEVRSNLQLDLSASAKSADFAHDAWVREQLECPLCLGLLWEPTTAPCGHTLCKPCLARTLDHAFDTLPSCPMCRTSFAPYLVWLNARAAAAAERFGVLANSHGGAQIPINRKLDRILRRHFAAEVANREAHVAEEEAAAGLGGSEGMGESVVVPIFICSLALPAVHCPLNIFEPRYRLMMRRCMDSGQQQFGMCVSRNAEYGTMLRITRYRQLPDGRSSIETIGTRRFRVLEWGEKDGYATGRVAWVGDDVGGQAHENSEEADGKAACKVERDALHGFVQHFRALYGGDPEQLGLGPQPGADGRDGSCCPAFVFWCIGLAQCIPVSGLSAERAYELCFGDAYREQPRARLRAVCEHFKGMFQFMEQRYASPGQSREATAP